MTKHTEIVLRKFNNYHITFCSLTFAWIIPIVWIAINYKTIFDTYSDYHMVGYLIIAGIIGYIMLFVFFKAKYYEYEEIYDSILNPQKDTDGNTGNPAAA